MHKTPYEAWTSLKSSVGHFRTFGLIFLRHVPEQLRIKLDDKIQAMILKGYHSTSA